MSFNNIFDKLAAAENSFLKQEFLCPVIRSKPVRVRIDGVVVKLSIVRPANFEGWGVFRPKDFKTANFVRQPTMQERQRYFDLFPRLRLIATKRNDSGWFGMPANSNDTRFKISGNVPIRLSEEIQMFDTVVTRFDGENCWFDRIDNGASLKTPAYLRESLAKELEIDKLTAGISDEHKLAYVGAFIREIESKKDRNEERIKAALERGGAEYRSYVERGDSYTVEYKVGNETHRSVVKKDTLEVQSAGICLSGYDKNFDLQSLVGVLQEGIRKSRIVRVGNIDLETTNRNDDDYDDYDD